MTHEGFAGSLPFVVDMATTSAPFRSTISGVLCVIGAGLLAVNLQRNAAHRSEEEIALASELTQAFRIVLGANNVTA